MQAYRKDIDGLRAVAVLPARLVAQGRDPDDFTIPRALFEARMSRLGAALDAIPDGPDLTRIRPADELCNEKACRLIAGGEPLYFDDNHLSLAGDALMVDDIANALRVQGVQPAPAVQDTFVAERGQANAPS